MSYGPQPLPSPGNLRNENPNAPINKIADWNYYAAIMPFQEYWNQADLDKRFVVGDQKYLQQYGPEYEYQKFTLNFLLGQRNMVVGHQRRTRKASRIIPVEGSDDITASQLNKTMLYVYNKANMYNGISECFSDAVDVGLTLAHLYLDYSQDPISGDLMMENLGYSKFIMDPWWERLDLSDCNFIYTRRYLRKDQIIDRLPESEEKLAGLVGGFGYDTKFTFLPQQYQNYRRNLLPYDEYWYKSDREALFVIDLENYEAIEISKEEEASEEFHFFMRNYGNAKVIKNRVPTVQLAIMVSDRVMYEGKNPLGIDAYPFVPFIGYMNSLSINFAYKWQGIIRQARDTNYLYNHRTQLELDMLESMFNGENFEEGALIDPNDAFLRGPGKKRFFKKGRLQGGFIESPGSRIDPSNFQATQRLKEDMRLITGINEELLGASDTDVGIVQMLKQGAGLTSLQTLFDNLDLSQRILTNVGTLIVQKNYTYGKIARIIGEEPSFEFKSKIFSKYDTQIEDAQMTTTSQQLAAWQFIELKKLGFDIPADIIIEKMPLQDKEELVQRIQEQTKQQQEQLQMQAQLQIENQRIVNESMQAKSQADQALAVKRIAQMDAQRMLDLEKVAQAEAERSRAVLDKVKAAKELQDMDLNQLERLINILKTLNEDTVDESLETTKTKVQELPSTVGV